MRNKALAPKKLRVQKPTLKPLNFQPLNPQVKAVMYVKEKGKITNREYRELTGLSDEGARIDLAILVEKGILESKGSGRSVHYVIK